MKQARIAVAVVTLAALGAGAALVVPALASSSQAAKTMTVAVTAKEFSFKLSKRSFPTGTTVIFKVTNKGKIGHDFKIDGKKTPLIQPGKSATLKVTFKKKGNYAYLCTVPGHAKLGMKGSVGVGVKAPATTTTTTTATTTVAGPGGTINVSMTEYHFTLSQSSVPQGNVTFVVKNDGTQTHNFDLEGKHIGTFLDPGQSETWTVNLAAKTYHYVCDVPYHASEGMEGDLTVTSS